MVLKCVWLGIWAIEIVVLPTVPLSEPETDGVPNAEVNAVEPPVPAVPETTRRALLLCVVSLVHPVGAVVC